MSWKIQNDEKQGPIAKTTLPSKAVIYNRRGNKELPRQEKAKGVCYHQPVLKEILKGLQ